MLCPKCLGFNYQRVDTFRAPVYEPCDYCDGAGIIHCCEGETPGVKDDLPTCVGTAPTGDPESSPTAGP